MDAIIEEMSPRQRAGLVVEGEAVDSAYSPDATVEQANISHLRDAAVERGRMTVRFVAEDDPNEFWNIGDERVVAGADKTFDKTVVGAMMTGHICIRCHEYQDDPFPQACSLCGYSMRELQTRDFAMEFRGGKHLGPSKPISDHVEEMQERNLRRRFEKKIREGGSRMRGRMA